MQATRRKRMESVIQEELSYLISRQVKDPRIPAITLTAVEITPDARQATIFFAILGGAQGGMDGSPPLSDKQASEKIQNCMEGLTSAAGLLKRYLSRSLNTRHVPNLIFREDRGFENAIRVQELLKKISETS